MQFASQHESRDPARRTKRRIQICRRANSLDTTCDDDYRNCPADHQHVSPRDCQPTADCHATAPLRVDDDSCDRTSDYVDRYLIHLPMDCLPADMWLM